MEKYGTISLSCVKRNQSQLFNVSLKAAGASGLVYNDFNYRENIIPRKQSLITTGLIWLLLIWEQFSPIVHKPRIMDIVVVLSSQGLKKINQIKSCIGGVTVLKSCFILCPKIQR